MKQWCGVETLVLKTLVLKTLERIPVETVALCTKQKDRAVAIMTPMASKQNICVVLVKVIFDLYVQP